MVRPRCEFHPMTGTSDTRHETGRQGEHLAAWFLSRRGYQILERNVRLGRHEIDLVALSGRRIVFVEVKTRRANELCSAIIALRPAQRRRIVAASMRYLREKNLSFGAIRFDVIAIDESADSLRLEHLTDAFGLGGELR